MIRRLSALALVVSTGLFVEPALAGPPPPAFEPASEPSEPSSEPPIEGPALPPSELPPPSIEPEPREQGSIEFVVQPPEPPTSPPPVTQASLHEGLGKAPNNGAAFIAAGAWIIPVAALGTVLFVLTNRSNEVPPYTSEPWIITAGAGLGIIGGSMLGVGIFRAVQLSRWARRHRVYTLPQGAGLLASGTLAALFGVGLLINAIRTEDGVTGAISGGLLVSAPIQIAVGTRFTRRYERTGGWRPIQYNLTAGGLRLRF